MKDAKEKENILPVNCSSTPDPDAKKSLDLYETEIKNGLASEIKSHIAIAIALRNIKEKGLYSIKGFDNIYGYCEDTFSLSRGSCSEHINVAIKLCDYNQEHKLALLDSYKDYLWSQLTVLQSMKEETRLKANPKMTVKELRGLKRDAAVKTEAGGKKAKTEQQADSNVDQPLAIVEKTEVIINDESADSVDNEIIITARLKKMNNQNSCHTSCLSIQMDIPIEQFKKSGFTV